MIQRDQQPFQNVRPVACPCQIIFRPPLHNFQPVLNVDTQRLLQRQHARLALHQRQHDNAERALQRRQLEQIVEHILRIVGARRLDANAHAVAVRLIAQIGQPSSRPSRCKSAMRVSKLLLFVWYGSSVMTMRDLLRPICSICALPRTITLPRPEPYAFASISRRRRRVA